VSSLKGKDNLLLLGPKLQLNDIQLVVAKEWAAPVYHPGPPFLAGALELPTESGVASACSHAEGPAGLTGC
jgi:hypothetical protein